MVYDQVSNRVSSGEEGRIVMVHDDNNEKHFQWMTKEGIVDLDLYLFKDDAVFEPVYEQNVYLLYFHSYDDKYFFWVDPDKQDRQEMIQRVNEIINMDDIEEQQEQPQQPQPSQQDVNRLSTYLSQLSSQMRQTNLKDILTSSFIHQCLQDNTLSLSLLPHLPDGQQSIEYLKDNLLSSPFLQSLSELQEVIQSEEGPAVMYSMGLDGS